MKIHADDNELRVSVESGKYTFIKRNDDWRIVVLRYGMPWLTIESGSNAVLALLQETHELYWRLEGLEK